VSRSRLSEEEIIRWIAKPGSNRGARILRGIGDDAAVLSFQSKLLATCDALQEGIHFDWKYTPAHKLGRKALAVNLSDAAAMGGRPLWALLSLAVPASENKARVREFIRGLHSMARESGVSIVGGDTDRSPSGWKITITLLGEVERPIYRSGAKPGDEVWVTGFLGCSALGLECLRTGMKARKFVEAHLNPNPRVAAGLALSKSRLAHSMMDISDGLLLDLERLCQASRVGAELDWAAIPRATGFEELCRKLRKDPKTLALAGGEDYELLFTASVKNRNRLEALSKRIKLPFHRIGRIVAGKVLRVLDEEGKTLKLSRKGYSHF